MTLAWPICRKWVWRLCGTNVQSVGDSAKGLSRKITMKLEDLLGRTCVIGVSYFDAKGGLLKQSQFSGQVQKVDAELGITIQLRHSSANGGTTDIPQADFILPPNLDAWFKAPPGRYHRAQAGVDIENPDYLVTWDVHRTQEQTAEGQHEWWEWVANTERPQVGPSSATH